jgi:hypothetical protein
MRGLTSAGVADALGMFVLKAGVGLKMERVKEP